MCIIINLMRISTKMFYSNLTLFLNFIFIFLLWLLLILREVNRIPFDFLEGESELVSGFNVEFLRSLFALLFIGEYGLILFFTALTRFLYFINIKLLMFLFNFNNFNLDSSCIPSIPL